MKKTIGTILKFFDNLLTFHSIAAKITLAFIAMALFLLGITQFIVAKNLQQQEEELILSKEETDIQYIEDYISPGGAWSVQNGVLYKGFTPLGDGTKEKAHIWPFDELHLKTGTNFYTAIRTEYAKPEVLARTKNPEDSKYLRVAGSTTNAKGESIVGTFVPKHVSDILCQFDTYYGEVDVEGRPNFSYYKNLRDRAGNCVGYIVVGRDIAELKEQASAATSRTLGIIAVALAAALITMILIIKQFTDAMESTRNYLKQISSGAIPEKQLTIDSRDEMKEMADSINDMTYSLKERQRLGNELSLAKNIQANMLPQEFPAFPERKEFDVYATMDPAKEVGGDLYDFFLVDEKHLAVLVGDVSGKGVPAAFFMAITKTLIRTYAQNGMKPAEVFTKVNALLCERNEAALFVTAFMAVLDLENGTLTCVNAGHNPPLIKDPKGDFNFIKIKPGFVLAGLDFTKYKQTILPFPQGSRLYLYTDGVTEATNTAQKLYGEERLKLYLNQHKDEALEPLLHNLRRDINSFVGEAEQFDDITMLILAYHASMQPNELHERSFQAAEYELQSVLKYVENELEKLHCNMATTMRMVMVTEEIFNNIAKYAYLETGTTQIGIGLKDGQICLRFRDRGIPFDPTKHINEFDASKIEQNSLKGLGLFLVKNSTDNMVYKFANGENILAVYKKI